jgi:hypothetical protein
MSFSYTKPVLQNRRRIQQNSHQQLNLQSGRATPEQIPVTHSCRAFTSLSNDWSAAQGSLAVARAPDGAAALTLVDFTPLRANVPPGTDILRRLYYFCCCSCCLLMVFCM